MKYEVSKRRKIWGEKWRDIMKRKKKDEQVYIKDGRRRVVEVWGLQKGGEKKRWLWGI